MHSEAVVASKSRWALTVSTQMTCTFASFFSVAMFKLDTRNFKEPWVSVACVVPVRFFGRSSPNDRNNSSIGRCAFSSGMDVRLKHFAPCVSRSNAPSEIACDGMNKSEHQPMREMRHCRMGKSFSSAVMRKTESLTRRAARRDIEMVGSARNIVIVAQSVQRIRSRSPHLW
jgi:hypothetical protein